MNIIPAYYQKIIISLLILLGLDKSVSAQVICEQSRIDIKLRDGTEVILFSGIKTNAGSTPYYYLPTDLRFSMGNGNQEFLFQSYEEDQNDTEEGAIMHFLLTWGLGPKEEAEIKAILASHGDSLAIISGSVAVEPRASGAFSISSNQTLAQVLRRSLNAQGSIPSYPGAKMALSFHFKNEDALLVREAMGNTKKFKGIAIQMAYQYRLSQCHGSVNTTLMKDFTLSKDMGRLLTELSAP